jgi:hypothetical protein
MSSPESECSSSCTELTCSPWTRKYKTEEVTVLAESMYDHLVCLLPEAPTNKLTDSKKPASVKFRDVKRNAVVIECILKVFPDRVPSSYLVGDAVLKFDEMTSNRLFGPSTPANDRKAWAVKEGIRCKALLGRVRRRTLRNPDGSRCPELDRLKQLVVRRPKKTPELEDSQPPAPLTDSSEPTRAMGSVPALENESIVVARA